MAGQPKRNPATEKLTAPASTFGPDQTAPTVTRGTGLYIHLPFCLKKCPYCDFYSITALSLKEAYIRALISEMTLRRGSDYAFDTVYLGGGTPSVFSGPEIEKILNMARSVYAIDSQAEITMEINPGSVQTQALDGYRRAGVNRLSVGVQSFDNHNLKKLGRIHTAETAIQSLHEAVAAGFDNVGIDLIYGLPGQKKADWQAEIAQVSQFQIEHISCYMLSFESGTPLDASRRAGQIKALADVVVADMFRLTVRELAAKGYLQYEISNFARHGRQSRHNQKYWNGTPYLGLGAGAHSFDGVFRAWNQRNVHQYIRALIDGQLPPSGNEHLTCSQQILESIYLGLRTVGGIHLKAFRQRFGIDLMEPCRDLILELQDQGWVKRPSGRPLERLALSLEGMLFLDAIVDRMSDQLSEVAPIED